jgi:hypothetical protein
MKTNLFLLTVIILLLFVIKYFHISLINEKEKKLNYKHNQDILLEQIRSVYNDKIKLEAQNETLKNLSKKDGFDWYQDISTTHVIRELQKD